MDAKDLFFSCKTGDLQRVKHLIEKKEIDPNITDGWDSSPLYYACLCGHIEIVQFLLENGAKCAANTFEGERCLYGALTDEIRNMLKNFKVISSRTIRRAPFDEFMRRLYETKLHADVVFSVHGHRVSAHRGILSARSDVMARMFNTKWQLRDVIELNQSLISVTIFEIILQFIYTGQAEIPVDLIDDCKKLAKYLGMPRFEASIEDVWKSTFSWEMSKPGVTITTLIVDTPETGNDLRLDMYRLAQTTYPQEMCSWFSGVLPFDSGYMNYGFPDIQFNVDGLIFHCHKSIMCCRSDYFKALLNDHFGENHNEGDTPVISLNNISTDVFKQILCYVYSEISHLTPENVEDVLILADMFLLPGLKSQCGSAMINYIDSANVVTLIQTARLFNLAQLETACNEFIANNLSMVIDREDFRQLVVEDSEKVKDREETDSIDIVDEIRFYITNFISYSEMAMASEKLNLIDEMLEDLGLEG